MESPSCSAWADWLGPQLRGLGLRPVPQLVTRATHWECLLRAAGDAAGLLLVVVPGDSGAPQAGWAKQLSLKLPSSPITAVKEADVKRFFRPRHPDPFLYPPLPWLPKWV